MFLTLPYPQIDPIAIELGPLAIRWYALAYIAGLLLGWRYCRALSTKSPSKALTMEAFDDFLLWATLGVVLGGRLGYVLFYQPGYYLSNPLSIAFLWHGGMAFHGGLLGMIGAMYLFARKRGIGFFALTDIVACATPIGLFFGRVSNFINGELYGRPAEDVPWAMVFPAGGPVARHPSQIYEALLEGAVLFAVLFVLQRRGCLHKPGTASGVFLLGYGLARFIVEFFREPDAFLGFLVFGTTMGQILSLPMMAVGVGILVWTRRRTAERA
ncbi:prolipoprotein diacylglyceryl transferase [Ferruginivarius sediminum]|uniref:Phosphatidylglycerol--prolipoprotein diacylglyceryl transferase n=1 Tax=Ferruginivarius sediminum TaxID=2661937 RepID=A0A369TBF4_9PROT|nr:prolipoprotein diacylglyceryl transferase [Ferruginivarius sediminum]RDD62653.1 prolipoprotein diacylglyceryl transferase [Ferruginivarius sediminum]